MNADTDLWDALRLLRDLPPDGREKLVVAIEKTGPLASLDMFGQTVAEKAEYETADTYRVQNLVKAFAQFLPDQSQEPEELATRMREAFVSIDNNVSIPDGFDEAVQRILRCEKTLGVTGKAHDIKWGVGNPFVSARTFSSVRPVFLSDVSLQPDHAVLIHELRLTYLYSSGVTSELVIAMDRQQIEALMEVLERCLIKEATMRDAATYKFLEPS